MTRSKFFVPFRKKIETSDGNIKQKFTFGMSHFAVYKAVNCGDFSSNNLN